MTDWDKTVEEYNNPGPGDEVRCINCDRRIRYSHTLMYWSHFDTALVPCEPMNVATPPLNYRP